MELVSIIVPVYNVERMLEKCMNSLLAQTYETIQIILVDDGSLDLSGKICDEFAAKDQRVKVIHKENGGVSSARNRGIIEADGKYLAFVDSDDYVEKEYIEKMLENLIITNSQLSVCSFDNEGVIRTVTITVGRQLIRIQDDQNRSTFLIFHYIMSVVWNKLFIKKIIVKNNIWFNESIHYGEDSIFVLEYVQYCDKIVSLSERLYHYEQPIMSAIQRFHPNRFLYITELSKVRMITLQNLKLDNDYVRSRLYARALLDFNLIVMYYLYSPLNNQKIIEIYEKTYEFYFPYIKDLKYESLGKLDIGNDCREWYKKYMNFIKNGDMNIFFDVIYKKEILSYKIKNVKTRLRNLIKILN